MGAMQQLDPHERPPDSVRGVYKRYQKMKPKELDANPDVIDLGERTNTPLPKGLHVVQEWEAAHLDEVFSKFSGNAAKYQPRQPSIAVYEHEDMKGLHIIPSLLPPEIQRTLLSRLLHRHLSNPAHLTNIHTHYDIAYPPPSSSFFSIPPTDSATIATPINPAIHKPLTISQVLNKKLRWATLGGQYDWTAKEYPNTPPPAFPADIKTFLESLFPRTKAEAAIVNLYSPGDTLSVHRDVAESSPRGLISISLGCDAIFVIGTDDAVLTLRLRSGSAVYMSGASRFAWHGVPHILPGTCPDHLKQWPGVRHDHEYIDWAGWMENKRVNLNVRQMSIWT
ncbi:oxidoreductase [Paraphoma chrysanthemicola]|nr:oxidoreductase [Paraphoma chrysanthemicola]